MVIVESVENCFPIFPFAASGGFCCTSGVNHAHPWVVPPGRLPPSPLVIKNHACFFFLYVLCCRFWKTKGGERRRSEEDLEVLLCCKGSLTNRAVGGPTMVPGKTSISCPVFLHPFCDHCHVLQHLPNGDWISFFFWFLWSFWIAFQAIAIAPIVPPLPHIPHISLSGFIQPLLQGSSLTFD